MTWPYTEFSQFIVRVRVWVIARVMVLVSVRVRVTVVGKGLICQSEPSRERVKVSHVIVECRVINNHPA